MDDLYKKIKNLCQSSGVTITQMCKEANVSRSPLSELKMGRSKTLSSATLQKIANYFSISVDSLMGADPSTGLQTFPIEDIIETLCENKGITVAQMCADIGIRRSALQGFLPGDVLAKMEAYFDLPEHFLIEEQKKALPPSPEQTREERELMELRESMRRNPKIRTMFSLTKNATPKDLDKVISIILAIQGDDDD